MGGWPWPFLVICLEFGGGGDQQLFKAAGSPLVFMQRLGGLGRFPALCIKHCFPMMQGKGAVNVKRQKI